MELSVERIAFEKKRRKRRGEVLKSRTDILIDDNLRYLQFNLDW